MDDLDTLVELQPESLPVTQPRVFDSKNYYEIFMETSQKYEKLLVDYRNMEQELKQRDDLIETYIKWKDTFENRVISIPVSKLKANIAFCEQDDMIYISFDDHDKIKWIKNEKEFQAQENRT